MFVDFLNHFATKEILIGVTKIFEKKNLFLISSFFNGFDTFLFRFFISTCSFLLVLFNLYIVVK